MASITLEQSIASVVRFILDNDVEGTKAYFDEIPESFYSPSVYFPVPYVEGQKVTLRSFRNTITFVAWFQARTDWDAEARAANVRDQLMLQGLHIPILDTEGNETGLSLNIQEPQQRKIEEGIVSLTIPVLDYFYREQEQGTKMNTFIIIWNNAISEFREEDE